MLDSPQLTAGIRVGIDTGGTFTDVVALDEDTGELVTTKTPSTPADPADGFLAGIDKVLGAARAPAAATSRPVSHGTTVATNQLLEGKVGRLGFITTEGFEYMLEIARQSVPDGYGNSYFWVKPDRDRAAPTWCGRSAAGSTTPAPSCGPFDEDGARAVARWFRDRGIDTIGVCFLHSYANPAHEERMREVLAGSTRPRVVSLSARGAARVPRVRAGDDDAGRRRGQAAGVGATSRSRHAPAAAPTLGGRPDGVPFYVMKSNGGVLSRRRGGQPADHHRAVSGPAAGALGAALIAQAAGFDRVLTCDGGGTSTDVAVVVDGEPTLTTEGTRRRVPGKIPMIDVVTVGAGGGSVAWLSPEGALKVGPQSAGADPGPLCYGRGGTEVTVTDAHLVLGRIPPHLLGGEIPLDAAAAAGRARPRWRRELGPRPAADCAAGILEISAWNQANALRQVTVKRGLDVRDFTLVTFGGSGSLLLCRLIDILGVAGVLVPPDPGNVSAFGLLTVDVRNDYVRPHVARHDELDPDRRRTAIYAELPAQAAAGARGARASRRGEHGCVRSADLRYFGQAFEVRVPVARRRRSTRRAPTPRRTRSTTRTARCTATTSAATPAQQVEWVNLRVTGIGPIQPARDRRGRGRRRDRGRRADRPQAGRASTPAPSYVDTADLLAAATAGRATSSTGPAVIEEYGATVPVHPGFAARLSTSSATCVVRRSSVSRMTRSTERRPGAARDRQGQPRLDRGGGRDRDRAHRRGPDDPRRPRLPGRHPRPAAAQAHRPVLLARWCTRSSATSRSRRCGRATCSSTTTSTCSEGGIGHLPDLCVTVPVFHDGAVVAFVQAFGHHDDIGGAVPGSMPSHATSVFEEGLMVPPIRLWDAGVPNQAALTIMTRNSRMPDSLAADLDAECSACLMGARRLGRAVRPVRPAGGRGLLRRDHRRAPPRRTGREILAKIPDGTWVWEDYAEHDGVDPPRLHAQRITLTRTPAPTTRTAEPAHPRLHRHVAAGQGPDQPLRRLRRRGLPGEVARADPAQPGRHARSGWPSWTSTRASCR